MSLKRRPLLPLTLLLALGLLALAPAARAEFHMSSDVLVPYFEVDLQQPGRTTLFAVSNAFNPTVTVQISVHTNWGIPVLNVQRTLKRHQVATFNLRDWLVDGRLPNRTLTPEALAHVQAALSGQPSPQDQLYYSTEVVRDRAIGYVRIKVLGHAASDALWGDYFILDSLEDFSQGETLVNVDPGIGIDGICKRHAMRFLEGGAFSAGTEVLIWSDKVGHPSANPQPAASDLVEFSCQAYDEAGVRVGERNHSMLPVELIPVSELQLAAPYGWLDMNAERLVFISGHYTSGARYSSALHAYCLPELAGPGPAISVEKLTNGLDVSEPPGSTVPVGGAVHWSYIVTNVGDVPLTEVTLVDDRVGAIDCPTSLLGVGEAMTCTAEGTAQACQYSNQALATGKPPAGDPVSARDVSFYYGSFKATLTVEKRLNGEHVTAAPGPTVDQGTILHWTYLVANSGEVKLTSVGVTDDQGFSVACPKDALDPAETMTCTAESTAGVGAHSNLGTASGLPPCGERTSAEDRSWYTGRANEPAIGLVKLLDGQVIEGPPGPTLPLGMAISWTYSVTNTGNTPLGEIKVTDDTGLTVSCPQTTLEVGASFFCNAKESAEACLHVNHAVASGRSPGGVEVSANATSWYTGEIHPAIQLVTRVEGQDANTPPGPTILVGETVHWSYQVTNTGDVQLTGITVGDDHDLAVTCPKTVLEPAEQMTCTATSAAVVGTQAHFGLATALPPCGESLSAQDPAHYTGQPIQPAIGLVKLLNGQGVEGPPGPTLPVGTAITWTYRATNTGNVALHGIAVTDDTGLAVTCPKDNLAPGESMGCSASETASACAHVNHAAVLGRSPAEVEVTANATSWYTGEVHPAIHLVTLVEGLDANTAPGPTITTGQTVHWSYSVQNSGDVQLTGITVGDDHGLVAACPKTVLDPGETMTCVATSVAVTGQQVHLGRATGQPTCGNAVADQDPAYYKGCAAALEGCTPGYWKNHTSAWPATGYSTGQRVDSVFAQADHFPSLANDTLLQALYYSGGSGSQGAAEILLRAGVAALLNAAHPGVNYPRSVASVVTDVDNALATVNRDTMLALAAQLDADNNLGCPLH